MKRKILLLGLGFWGSQWLEIILRAKDTATLAGVAGSPAELAAAARSHALPAEILYDDYKKAIAQADADIAIIVIPAALHVDAALLALEKGLHIIMEKPLALTMADAQSLLKKKQALRGPNLMLSQNYRWRPHTQAMKRAITGGMLGKIESVTYEFRKQEDLQGYRAGLQMPLLQDVCIHHFDLIRFLTGSDCAEIFCQTYRPGWSAFAGSPCTDALLTMRNGVRVSYTGTWAARGMETSWDGDIAVTGEKGCLKLRADNSVIFYPHLKNDAVSFAAGLPQGQLLEQPLMELSEMEYGFYEFMRCVNEGILPETTIEDNIKSFAIVTAALRSVETGEKAGCE